MTKFIITDIFQPINILHVYSWDKSYQLISFCVYFPVLNVFPGHSQSPCSLFTVGGVTGLRSVSQHARFNVFLCKFKPNTNLSADLKTTASHHESFLLLS